jgi:segregation and condensation protein A
MATGTVGVMATSRSRFDLEELVKNATWRELLIELVESNKLDPWDIDLSVVIDEYIQAIKQMKILDLRIPANMILAASILLRMKSEMVSVFKIEEQAEAIEENGGIVRVVPEVAPLVYRFRAQPKRKITLEDLMDALAEAMKVKGLREVVWNEEHEPLQILIHEADIDERIESAYALVKANLDPYNATTFSALALKFNSVESILMDLFIPLLFLAHKDRITLMQEKFFDEIIIRLTGEPHGKRGG